MTNDLVSRPELAERFGVTKETVIRWERQGKLKPIRLGASTVRYRREDVEQFIASAANPGATA